MEVSADGESGRYGGRGGQQEQRDRARGYLREFRELAAIYGEKASSLAPDPDSRPLIDHYTRVVQEQISSLSRQVMETYEAASAELCSEVDDLLEMTAGRTLAAGAKGPMTTLRSLPAFAAAGPIFTLIKKILRLLVEKLGFSIPGVIDGLLELADEILGEQAGNVSEAAAERAHRSEIKYLEAQYHLTRLVQLKEAGGRGTRRAEWRLAAQLLPSGRARESRGRAQE